MNTEFRFMPEQASSIAEEIDALYMFLVAVSGFFIVLIAFLIIYFAIKYRRGSAADRRQGESHFFLMELSWVVVPLVLSLIMFYQGAKLYFQQTRAPATAMEIDGVGRQWMWKFQHPEGNAEINDLHVPLNQPVKLRLISEDVIHSFYVPAFRVKQDVLPGRYTSVWFNPTKEGEYHLFCAEYCGAKHAEMRGRVIVMKPRDYQAWLSGTESMASTDAGTGRLLDEFRCTTCHFSMQGLAARGPPLDNLFGSQVRLQDGQTVTADENYIRESILRPAAKVVAGYPAIMPSYEGQISEEGILQLIREIKALTPPAHTPAENGAEQERKAPAS